MTLKRSTLRQLLSAGWILVSLVLFARPLRDLVELALANEDSSYVLVIPFLAAVVLFIERRELAAARGMTTKADPAHHPRSATGFGMTRDKVTGACLLLLAGLLALLAYFSRAAASDHLRLSVNILALLLFCVAGFAFLYGRAAVQAARFPFLFLLLMVPLPDSVLEPVIYALQAGSAWVTSTLFELLRVPYLREGFVFHLARVDIAIARECSGIRSSMVLLVLALLIAHFQLKSLAAKALFVITGIFMMILKNGIRIATLTLLAMYVDPRFLSGSLHQRGGVVFFVLALLLLLPVLSFLRRGESWWQAKQTLKVSQGSTT